MATRRVIWPWFSDEGHIAARGVMEEQVPETVFYRPERLTRSGPLGPDLLAVPRGYERSISRNLTVALTFLRHIGAISDV
jgi:hypothetical protein